ncbi:ATP-dependent DNA helicase RecG [[Clostridium] spiroforme]|nr:ATP-dependent DNA helicase RecG [Thomasclavelia spiroformis]
MEYNLKVLKIKQNRIQLLNEMSIFTVKDLILHYPYRYEEMIETPLHDEHKVIVEGILLEEPKLFFKGRLSRMTFHCDCHGENITVIIFNRHYLKKSMQTGMTLTIIGKYEQKRHTLVASDLKLKKIKELEGITPVYSLKEGITAKSFRGYVKKALAFYQGHIADIIPDNLCQKYSLINREDALNKVHFPQLRSDVINAIRYLKYEEFFKFQLTMQYIKMNRTKQVGVSKLIDKEKVDLFIRKLPFILTDDQVQVVEDILLDLASSKLMYRFVQGDVGSGKTVVGAIGLYANYLAGYQGALMAPTEILAMQHYQSLQKLFKRTKVSIVLLTGKLSVKEKNTIYQQIENGEVDIIIGTHALFQEKVNYHRLGFVITDEQHRFGVEQRKALKDKGQKVDFMIMTATPIPRTLALSLYGDMDVSTISTMPAGRKEVITRFIKSTSMKPILNDLKQYLRQGGQCYVVCPLVNESEVISGRNAVDISQAMASYFKDQYHVGLIHGQMNDEEKNRIMNDFKNNHIQILVSTTVIEVGVDVANANMIVIYNAERFGLSQLHQLRGRVGRSKQQGYCYLLSEASHPEQQERLEFLQNHHNGFEVSEYDLKMRGPGDILGHKQSGLPTFMIGDIFKDYHILEIARKDAHEILKSHHDDEKVKKLLKEIENNLTKNNEYID